MWNLQTFAFFSCMMYPTFVYFKFLANRKTSNLNWPICLVYELLKFIIKRLPSKGSQFHMGVPMKEKKKNRVFFFLLKPIFFSGNNLLRKSWFSGIQMQSKFVRRIVQLNLHIPYRENSIPRLIPACGHLEIFPFYILSNCLLSNVFFVFRFCRKDPISHEKLSLGRRIQIYLCNSLFEGKPWPPINKRSSSLNYYFIPV